MDQLSILGQLGDFQNGRFFRKAASAAEGHPSELFSELFCFNRVSRLLESVGDGHELAAPLLIGTNCVLEQIHKNTIRTDAPVLRDAVYSIGDPSRKGDAAPNWILAEISW